MKTFYDSSCGSVLFVYDNVRENARVLRVRILVSPKASNLRVAALLRKKDVGFVEVDPSDIPFDDAEKVIKSLDDDRLYRALEECKALAR